MDLKELDKAISDLETSLERLQALYNQYFMGIEKLEPTVQRKAVDRKINLLRRQQVQNTAQRFRLQSQIQKYNTQQTYWRRICRQIEEGTYQRHVMLAKRRQEVRDKKRQSEAPPKAAAQLDGSASESPQSYTIDLDDSGDLLNDPFLDSSGPVFDQKGEMDSLDDPFADSSPAKELIPTAKVPPAPQKPTPKTVKQNKTNKQKKPKESDLKSFFNKPPPPPVPSKKRPQPGLPRPQKAAASKGDSSSGPSKVQLPRPKKVVPEKAAPKNAEQWDRERAKKIYRTYLAARKKCNESTDNLTMAKVEKSLKNQHKAKGGDVDFKVVIRKGKAIIKTVKKS